MAAPVPIAGVIPPIGGPPPGVVGNFVVVMRKDNPELDEFLVLAAIPNHAALHIVLTTQDAHPFQFEYRLLELCAGPLEQGGFRVMVGITDARTPPLGVDAAHVNFICDPATLTYLNIGAPQLHASMQEAAQQAHFLGAEIQAAHVARRAPVLGLSVVERRNLAAGGVVAMPAVGLGGPGAPLADGLGGHVAAPSGAVHLGPKGETSEDNKKLMDEVLEMRAMFEGFKNMKLEKSSRKKKKSSSSTKKKKKKKGRGDSSTSSSSDSSSGSSQPPNSKYMQVPSADAKRTKYSQEHYLRFNTMRFRKRSDLLNFAARYPGALAAQFLTQVRQKMSTGLPADTEELLATDTSSWAQNSNLCELKDVRDSKEAVFLCRLLTELNHKRLPQCADMIACRLREMKMAKREGGSWEKASVVSLMPSTHGASATLPDSAFML